MCHRCQTHFCVVCGDETNPEEGTRHWNPHFGRCPLYGQPGEQQPAGAPPDLERFAPFLAALPDFALGVLPAGVQNAVQDEQARQRQAANQLAFQVNAVIMREDEHRVSFALHHPQALQWPGKLRQRRAAGARQGDAGEEEAWEDLVIVVPQRDLQDMREDAAPPPPPPGPLMLHGNEIVEQVVDLPGPGELPGDVLLLPPLPPMRPDTLRTRRLRALARREPVHGLQEELVVVLVVEVLQAVDGRDDEAEDAEAPPPPLQSDEEWVHVRAGEPERLDSRRALEQAVGDIHRRLGPIGDRAPSPPPVEPEEIWEPGEEGQDEPEEFFELEDLSDSDSIRQQPNEEEVWEPDDDDRESEGHQGDLFDLWHEVADAYRDFEQGNFPPSPPALEEREIDEFDRFIAEMRKREALGLPALPQGETNEEREELIAGVEARIAQLAEDDPERGFQRMVLRGMLRRRGV